MSVDFKCMKFEFIKQEDLFIENNSTLLHHDLFGLKITFTASSQFSYSCWLPARIQEQNLPWFDSV
jgi:hypothetical protein